MKNEIMFGGHWGEIRVNLKALSEYDVSEIQRLLHYIEWKVYFELGERQGEKDRYEKGKDWAVVNLDLMNKKGEKPISYREGYYEAICEIWS